MTTEPPATAGLADFVAALYGATQDPFRLTYGDVTEDVGDDLTPFEKAAGDEPIYLFATTASGAVPFLYTLSEEPTDDAWTGMLAPGLAVRPTAILTKGCKVFSVYALTETFQADAPETIALAAAMGGAAVDPLVDPIPTPRANGWVLAHFDSAHHTALAVLADAFGTVPAPGVVARPASSVAAALGKHRDATIRTVFDFEDPRLQEKVTITGGANRKSVNWTPSEMTRGRVLDVFCRHTEAASKDGPAVVLGQMKPGRRLLESVEAMHFVGLDFDSGIDGDVLAEAIADTGLMAVMASSHSHLKTTTVESLSSIQNWLAEVGREDEEITQAVVRERMAEKGLEPEIVASMTFEVVGEGAAQNVVISHAPIPKWRVILPLFAPFVIADRDSDDASGLDIWRNVPRALARRLGGLPLDQACTGASRLWYLPSHPASREDWRIDLFGGDLVDVDQLLADWHVDEEAAPAARQVRAVKRGSRAVEGAFGKRWAKKYAAGFDIADLLVERFNPDKKGRTKDARLRGWSGAATWVTLPDGEKEKRRKHLTIRCPFEAGHSNSTEKDDTGCYVANAGDGRRGDGFVITCLHGSCAGRDRLDHLNKMVNDGWFDAEDVARFDSLDHDDAEPADEEVDVEAALAEFAGLSASTTVVKSTVQKTHRKAGGVAIDGVLEGLDGWDPKKCLFEGPKAADDAIDALGKVASVVKMGNKMRIVVRAEDGLGFFSESEARLFFKPYRAEIEVGTDKNGEPKLKWVDALDLLLKSDRRQTWKGIDCDPSNSLPSHVLNTWEGIEIAPEPGDCSLLKAHILNSVCAGNADHAHYLTQWFAHMVQRPTEKPGVAPVVVGPKGSGKSTVADFVRRAIGRKHSVKIAQAKHLVSNFNAHLAGMLFCQAEEVTFGADRKGEGPLKDVITAKTALTEKKGLDAYQETNFTRFFLVSNDGHVVPASDGERRWFVLYTHDLFAGRPMNDPERIAYFNALNDEADAGGIAAFLDYLMTYDLTGFTPYAAPDTDALSDQKLQGLSDEDLWVYGVLQTGAFDDKDGVELGDEWELDEPLEIDQAIVRSSYASHVKRYGGSSGGAGVALKALLRHGEVTEVRRGPRGSRKRFYQFAARRGWQDRFSSRFGIGFTVEREAD